MFNSIRWRVLSWQAFVLLAVLAGLGFALVLQVRRARFEEIDADLLGAAQSLSTALQADPAGAGVAFPESYRTHFGKAEHDRPYFRIWTREGTLLAASGPAERIAPDGPRPGPRPYHARDRGMNRELILRTADQLVLVGRNIHRERDGLQRLTLSTAAWGAAALAVGLFGTWFLADRSLAPIQGITQTAEAISATNLAQRIDPAHVPTELTGLVSVLNRMFARLEAAFEQQVRFTGDAAHELRTPVTVVLSQAEMALSRERTPEDYRESLQICERTARRMRSLVDGLLTLARADAGQLDLLVQPVNLAETVRETAETFTQTAAERQVTLTLDLQEIRVPGDPLRLSQAVSNLLSNAILYNRPGGSVHVSLKDEDAMTVLAVSNTGPGIPAEMREKVFERFFRADPSRSETPGTGLGLSICREILHAHGGTLSIGDAPGNGALFIARLPKEPR